jgi:hypothetical protein
MEDQNINVQEEPVQEEQTQMSAENIINILIETLQAREKEIEMLKSELQLTSKELGEAKKKIELHDMECKMPRPEASWYASEFIREQLNMIKDGIKYLREQLREYPEDKFLKIKLEQALHVKNFLEEKGGYR